LITIAAIINFKAKPFGRFFVERDPTLSYPYIADQSVPISFLVIISYVIPTIIIIGTQILFRLTKDRSKEVIDHPCSAYTEHPLHPHVGMIEALGLTLFITFILKNFVGRLRPNFFAYCNYKGYRNALMSGNFTSYNNITQAGVIGSIEFCLETSLANINDSQSSFPSGHSSLSFAGLTFLSFYLFHVAPHHFNTRNHTIRLLAIKIAILLILFISAAFVAGSRTRDYWHNFDDILAGAVLGFGSAVFSFWANHDRLEDSHKATEQL